MTRSACPILHRPFMAKSLHHSTAEGSFYNIILEDDKFAILQTISFVTFVRLIQIKFGCFKRTQVDTFNLLPWLFSFIEKKPKFNPRCWFYLVLTLFICSIVEEKYKILQYVQRMVFVIARSWNSFSGWWKELVKQDVEKFQITFIAFLLRDPLGLLISWNLGLV